MAMAAENNASDPYLDIRAVAQESSLSKATIYREIARGEFPVGAMVSRNRRGRRQSEIEQWKAAREAGMTWQEWQAANKEAEG